MKIGLFDSGLGGLLILKAVTSKLPWYDYEYYGDTQHLPYGDKTEAEIYRLTKQGIQHLFERDCVLIIIACNTASAETLRRLQDEFLPEYYPHRRILGVIVPVVEEVIDSACKKVLLFATKRTVSSGKYHLELGKRNEIDTKIESIATPKVVPLIEEGKIGEAVSHIATHIDKKLATGERIDGVILGCTHYVLLADALQERFGSTFSIFSQHRIIPNKLDTYLQRHPEIEARLTRQGRRNIFLTEHRSDYDRYIATLLEGHFVASN